MERAGREVGGESQGRPDRARAGYEKQLEAFRHQRDQALEQMRRVQGAAGDAWIDLAHGADDAWAKMREAFEKARTHFQK